MSKEEFNAIINDLRLKLPGVDKYNFVYSFKDHAIYIQGKGGYEEVIDLDHKPKEMFLEELINKMKVLLQIYKSKTII